MVPKRVDCKGIPDVALTWRRNRVEGALPQAFFSRNTVEVAQDLLGKVLVVRSRPEFPFEDPSAQVTAGIIVETEAYRADDPASHSARGQTTRNAVMFGEPGVAYVYFIYGMYEMLNFVTEPVGAPGAVLIRALEPVHGEALLRRRRPGARKATDLTSGPGKLCNAMGIRMSHNGQSLQGPSLFVVDAGLKLEEGISVSPRVGINVGVEEPWRFFLTGNRFVSRAPQNAQARPLGRARKPR